MPVIRSLIAVAGPEPLMYNNGRMILFRHQDTAVARRLCSVESNITSLKQVVGAAIVDSLAYPNRLLVARRSAPPALAGLWEFPGGKVEPGETCTQALHRELMEELGVSVRLGSEVKGPHEQGWLLNERAAMRVWLAELASGVPRPLEDHDLLDWLDLDSADTLEALPWIPADYPIVDGLLAVIGQSVPDPAGPAPGR